MSKLEELYTARFYLYVRDFRAGCYVQAYVKQSRGKYCDLCCAFSPPSSYRSRLPQVLSRTNSMFSFTKTDSESSLYLSC